jgi:hypothetical protein
MELEGSLPCIQEPATGPYPEPDESGPYPPNHFFSNFNIILAPTYKSCKLHPSVGFYYRSFVCFHHRSHACYMPRPSHPPRFHNSNMSGKEYVLLCFSLSNFLYSPVISSLLRYKNTPHHPVLLHP